MTTNAHFSHFVVAMLLTVATRETIPYMNLYIVAQGCSLQSNPPCEWEVEHCLLEWEEKHHLVPVLHFSLHHSSRGDSMFLFLRTASEKECLETCSLGL